MPGYVSVFSGEEEGICDRLGHLSRGVKASRGDIAVGAECKRIVLPVVRVTALQLLANFTFGEPEDSCQREACLDGELFLGQPRQRGRTRSSHPACEGVARLRMRRPPHGRHFGKGKEEAELAERRLRRQALPELFLEDQREASHLSHAQMTARFEDGFGLWGERDTAALQRRQWKGDNRLGGSEGFRIG